MAYTSTLNLTLSITGVGPPARNEQSTPIASVQNLSSVGEALPITLINGDNVIGIPAAGCQFAIFIPNPNNGSFLRLKGVGADTGFLLATNLPAVIPVLGTTGSFIINNAGSTLTGNFLYLV